MVCNRNVLFIGTPMINYHKHIIKEFERQGYTVDFYNDRPSENSFIKGMIKIRRNYVNALVEKYFDGIIEETSGKDYDLVFVINGKVLTEDIVKRLRESQKNARFVLYLWDSLELYPHVKELIRYFDKAFSFDSDDCDENKTLELLPLFYCRPYEKVGRAKNEVEIKYDLVSICTAHPNRYRLMKQLFPKLQADGIRIYSYMFLNRLQYMYNKAFVEEFKKSRRSEFSFKPLSEKENIEIIRQADTIFDIPHSKQSGLTIRTIEALGIGKKLITTNANVKKYDFYNSTNVYILGEDNDIEMKQFIRHSKFEAIDSETYNRYSLRNWIQIITKS